MKLLRLCLLLLIFPGLVAAQAGWRTYQNARYGYTVSLPPTLVPAPAPADGDGQMWESLDKSLKVSVYGTNNLDRESLAFYMRQEQKLGPVPAAYRASGKSWFVLSWAVEDKVSYMKGMVGKGSLNYLLAEYPRSQVRRYAPVVSQIEASFRPGDLSRVH